MGKVKIEGNLYIYIYFFFSPPLALGTRVCQVTVLARNGWLAARFPQHTARIARWECAKKAPLNDGSVVGAVVTRRSTQRGANEHQIITADENT